MIKSFRHKGLKKFFETGSTAGIQPAHKSRLARQLHQLNAAFCPDDMNLPGWGLHPLQGKNPKKQDVEGHYSISVNGNWRLTFYFDNGDAILVDYQDYH
ncbi:type II toxin-antitoxin system RelE/ParE family toxin [Acinetobacter sp. ANC 4640]